MKLYHGSTSVIETIDLTKSRPNKDFGLALKLLATNKVILLLSNFWNALNI